MHRFQALIALCCFSITHLAACASSPKPLVTGPGGTTQFSEVTVLSSGAEPKRALRYRLPTGATESVTVQILLGMSASGEERDVEVVGLPTKLTALIGPTERLENGHLRYTIFIQDAKADYPKNASLSFINSVERELSPLREVRGTVEMNDRGLVQAFKFHIPKSVPPRTVTLLGNIRSWLMSIPLPDEAVGVGAQWMAQRKVDLGGLMIDQAVRYELTSLQGNEISLEVVARQSGARQTFTDQGVDATLKTIESLATGSVQMSLTRLGTTSEADISTQMRISVEAKDQPAMPVKARLETAIRVESNKTPSSAKKTN